ncbi:TetR/AcrR family transcriptional regulator [Rouxiella silvae]|uniref:TetR/AcrR family transcriptional regulator n=1 Tax=Rouxiella silvae TaxID=1646373 RepID=A0AA41BXB2_9GAMM|nr:TetR/AcrR family transcriptional regulator [Rouxiella silvae]MBF6637423.1 TetR/AcrR family transcriptional regulator [Rouxiella silvae]
MVIDNGKGLNPRKQPQQVRSQMTVDAIFEATIQVLLSDGLQRLTTIRVAERAGVSVGTLYQYFPQKQALLFAVLQRHLEMMSETMELATQSAHNLPLSTMVNIVVSAFMAAKTENVLQASALYSVAGELDSRDYVREIETRNRARLEAMLETATDVHFDDLKTTAFMFSGALVGPIRLLLESQPQPETIRAFGHQLESLCLGYLERAGNPR